MKRMLLCGASLLALSASDALAVPAGQSPPNGMTPTGPLLFTPSKIINVIDPTVGAICDGIANDAPAINRALQSALNNAVVEIPFVTCRASATIIVPSGVTLRGTSFYPGNPGTGSTIKCDVSVSPCVSGGGNNGQPRIEKLIISRAGTPDLTAIGLQVADAYNASIVDVMSYNHGQCYQFLAHPSTGLGLGAMMTRTYSGNCLDAHIDLNGWPELRIEQSRFGMNGGQGPSNTFVRFEGGVSGTSAGPNTFVVNNSQFNAPSTHFVEWVKLGSGGVPAIDATDFKFSGLHVEGISGADFFSDESWNIVNRVNIADSSFNDGVPFLNLSSNTQMSVWNIANNQIAGTLTITPPAGLGSNAVSLKNNSVGTTILNGPGTVTVSGNAFNGDGLTINGSWGDLEVGPDTFIHGGFTNNTTTGVIQINEQGIFQSNGQNLTFGPQAGGGPANCPFIMIGGKSGLNPGWLEMNCHVGFNIIGLDGVTVSATGYPGLYVTRNGITSHNAQADANYTNVVPISGFGMSLATSASSVLLEPVGPIDSGTITLPLTTLDGQQIRISTTQTITTLTVGAPSGEVNKCTAPQLSLTQAAPLHCIYKASNQTWYPN